MITVECPLCTAMATLDDDLARLACPTCDTQVELVAEPTHVDRGLDRAA